MSRLVDIHAHLLPGIDDGPGELEGSLEMARAAVVSGIETVAVTPHLRGDFPGVRVEEIADRCEQLRAQLERHQIPLRVVEGAEVSLPWALDADEESLRLATYGQRGTDILIETPTDASMLERLLEPLIASGLRITLGHPERSRTFRTHPDLAERLSAKGVLAQVNGGAFLSGRRGMERHSAEVMAEHGFVQVIASDGHRAGPWRPVGALADGAAAAARVLGQPRAAWMASQAPLAIIEGRPLPPAPEVERPVAPVRRLFRFAR